MVELGNAAGFEPDVFARTEKVSVRVKLMPLLSRQVEMDTVSVHGLTLNLAKDKDGNNNWDDLAKGGEEAETASGNSGVAALAIGGLDIQDANLSWKDAESGQSFQVSNLVARTGSLTPGKPVELSVEFDMEGGPPKLGGHVAMSGELNMDQDSGQFDASGLTIEVNLVGDELPGGKANLTFAADVAANLTQQTANLSNLKLTALGLEANGQLTVTDYQTAPKMKGELSVSQFDPKAMLKELGQADIQTADPAALAALSLDTQISGSASALSLNPLKVLLDDTTLQGSLTLGKAIRFDLDVDAIDADRYLPPQSEGEVATPGGAAGGATGIPTETLRALDVDGKFAIGKLKSSKSQRLRYQPHREGKEWGDFAQPDHRQALRRHLPRQHRAQCHRRPGKAHPK